MNLMYQTNSPYTIPNNLVYQQYQSPQPIAYVIQSQPVTTAVANNHINSYPSNYYMPIVKNQNLQTPNHKCNAGGVINITITNPSVYGQNNNLKDRVEENLSKIPNEENIQEELKEKEDPNNQEEFIQPQLKDNEKQENIFQSSSLKEEKLKESPKELEKPFVNKDFLEKAQQDQNQTKQTQEIIQKTKTENIKEPENNIKLENIYLKNLKERLLNTNEQVRISAIKEIMSKFREEESLQNNKELISLLNMAIDDKSHIVRFFAMSTVAAGYTPGDEITKEKLDNMQYQKINYNEDAILASEALIKIASFNRPKNTQKP